MQHQPSASLSNPDSSLGTKNSRRERGRARRGGGHNHRFVFSQKGGVLLTLQRFKENRWGPLTAFTLQVLGNVSNSEAALISLNTVTGGVL